MRGPVRYPLPTFDRIVMPIYGRHFERGQLQFITTSTYRRSRLFTLSDHPKPAIYDHLKTGHMETYSGTLTTA